MADNRPINFGTTAKRWALLVLIAVIIGGFIVLAPILPYLAFLSAANGKTFTELLFNSAVIVSTFLISIAPITFGIFEQNKKGEEKRDKPGLRFLKLYISVSIVALLGAVILCSMWISETRYAASTEASLILLFTVTVGYFFLCFPIRTK